MLISSKGFENTGYYVFDGITGVKTPVLPMVLSLIIKNAPPPLTLLINPNSMSMTFAKKVNHEKTRADSFTSGYVIQYAKDELDVMQANGITAMMYNGGLCTSNNMSQSYDHFLKLLAYFENNGINYDDKFTTIPLSVGRVMISYDDVNYYGCFDDFNWKQTAAEPFNFTFSWNFTISSTIDTNSYSSYQYGTL